MRAAKLASRQIRDPHRPRHEKSRAHHSFTRARYHRGVGSVRVDSWIWAVRLAKTRSQATAACRAGHVRVNGAPAKAATPVRIGDEVRTRLHAIERIYTVTGLATRRGSATEAAQYFEDLTPPPPPRVERPAAVYRDPGAGRPTKRDRRQLEKLRGRDSSGDYR